MLNISIKGINSHIQTPGQNQSRVQANFIIILESWSSDRFSTVVQPVIPLFFLLLWYLFLRFMSLRWYFTCI